MPDGARLTREEVEIIIKNYEATGRDTTELKRVLNEAFPPVPPRRNPRATMNIMRDEEEPIEYSQEVIDYDRNHSLKELKTMAAEAGLSTSGDKKTLAKKLLGGG
ncbi:hypothetical protein ES703_110556 [subsurface metagenome]